MTVYQAKDCAAFYRKALWRDAPAYAEIWLEKDALSGVIYPVTANYDVPLMVACRFCIAPPKPSPSSQSGAGG